VLGFGFKTSTRNAAFVNGALSEILEMQDGNTKGGMHACDAVISASLAMCEWQGKSGKDLITAIVVGYDAANRVSETIYPTHHYKGFLPTGTAGTMGAAAAVGNILGLDAELLCNAFGIAGSILPMTTCDNHMGGYSIKEVEGGAPAKVGIESVLLAKQGLTAAPLEGDRNIQKGFCRIASDAPPNFEKMIERLGERFSVDEIYFKPYAACRVSHGPIELALELKKRHKLNVNDIESVLIKTYDFAAKGAGSIRTDVDSSFILCQFSTPYGVAAALLDGEVGVGQLKPERIRDPNIHQIAAKVNAIADAELELMYPSTRPAILEIRTKDGRSYSGRVDFAKGDYRNPMSEGELAEKFLSLTKNVLGKQNGIQVMDTVLDLENLEAVPYLIELLS
jgi:2-methylcitrate dehydratase PrpD